MFETFNVPAMYVATLLRDGPRTGTDHQHRDGLRRWSFAHRPHPRGLCIAARLLRLDLAGRDLTEYRVKILTERGCSFTTLAESEIVRNVRRSSPTSALTSTPRRNRRVRAEKTYELPMVTSSQKEQTFRCLEVLFQPFFIVKEASGSPSKRSTSRA